MALPPDPEQTRADQLAERRQREQEVLQREVDEAVRQDELGNIAKRYGKLIVGGAVLALVAFGGFLLWRDHSEGQQEELSEKLVSAFDQIDAGQLGPAEAQLAELSESGSSAPALSAKLARAGIAINQGRREDAAALYQSIADDADAAQPYRDLAMIRAVAVQFDELEPQTVVDRLKPLAVPGNPWFGSAGELVGMAYLKQGKEELAGPLFVAIATNEDVPQTLRSRTRQLAGLLGYDAVTDVDATMEQVREEGSAGPAPAAAQ